MGRIATGNRKYHVKRLTPLHFTILELVAFGHRNKQIAETLGVSRNTVSNVRKSQAGRAVTDEMQTLLDRSLLLYWRKGQHNMLAAVAPAWKGLRQTG